MKKLHARDNLTQITFAKKNYISEPALFITCITTEQQNKLEIHDKMQNRKIKFKFFSVEAMHKQ